MSAGQRARWATAARSAYGDQGQRGKRITSLLTTGDLLAFFGALRPVDGPVRPLIYALVGTSYPALPSCSRKIRPDGALGKNAHRRRLPKEDDIVVRAKPDDSGRLRLHGVITSW